MTASGLLPVAEAHARLMQLFAPLPAEEVPLAAAAGRVLARDVVAGRDQPPFPASAMDGYAIRAADAATGARLRVIGVSAAGARFDGRGRPRRGGAHLYRRAGPRGGRHGPDPGGREPRRRDDRGGPGREETHHIRPAGGDFRAGDRVAAPRRLGPSEIALLAAMNVARVSVARRPVVALIPTGDELVSPGETPGPDQIVSSNNFALKALLEADGAEARLLPIARDTAESLASVFRLTQGADLIVTLGGASVGDFDLVQKTAISHGLALDFYKVAMRPGKPLMAGRLHGVPLVGLPGNPVSSIVCAHVFLRPAVARMLGLPGDPPRATGRASPPPSGPNGPREHYMRAVVTPEAGGYALRAVPAAGQLADLGAGRGQCADDPRPGRPRREPGETVEFTWL